MLTDLREGWFLYFQSFKPLSTIHLDVFCKSQRLSRIRTPSGGPPSDLEWPGFPTPQPGKTKYSSLSQISLRINKKSNVTLLVPRSPPGHLAKHPLSPNIGMDIEPRTCIIHPLYHSVISNMRLDLNPPCHNYCIYIFPCEEQSCASLEKFLHELWSHTWCTEVIPVEGKCVSPQE